MPPPKRRVLDTKCRILIAKVYHFLHQEYEFMKTFNADRCDLSPLANITNRTAEATGVSARTVSRILQEERDNVLDKKPTRKKRKLNQGTDVDNEEQIEKKVKIVVEDTEEQNIANDDWSSAEINEGTRVDNKELDNKVKIEVEETNRTEFNLANDWTSVEINDGTVNNEEHMEKNIKIEIEETNRTEQNIAQDDWSRAEINEGTEVDNEKQMENKVKIEVEEK